MTWALTTHRETWRWCVTHDLHTHKHNHQHQQYIRTACMILSNACACVLLRRCVCKCACASCVRMCICRITNFAVKIRFLARIALIVDDVQVRVSHPVLLDARVNLTCERRWLTTRCVTLLHTHIHIHVQVCICACVYTQKDTYTHTHTRARARVHIHQHVTCNSEYTCRCVFACEHTHE